MRSKLEVFTACLLKYEPFVMGGEVWQPRSYPVVGAAVTFGPPGTTLGWRNGFVWKTDWSYMLHDRETGFLVCEAPTASEAVRKACELLAITPDFNAQAAKLGKAENHPLIAYDEAVKLLARTAEESKAKQAEHDKLLAAERQRIYAAKHQEEKRAQGNDRSSNKRRTKRAKRVEKKNR